MLERERPAARVAADPGRRQRARGRALARRPRLHAHRVHRVCGQRK